MNKLIFATIVALHYLVVFCLVLTAIYSWALFPIYVYVTIVVLIIRVLYSRDPCPLTVLENKYRERLGYCKSRGFVLDWIVKPIKKVIYD